MCLVTVVLIIIVLTTVEVKIYAGFRIHRCMTSADVA